VVAATESDDRVVFDEWKQMYAQRYASAEEEAQRFEIFQTNLRHYEARTANDTAIYGPDGMADRTPEEFRAKYSTNVGDEFKGQYPPEYCTDPEPMDVPAVLEELGDSVDWRSKGAVTPVKNQGQFGSCWSFGATGVMEGINVIQGGNPLESVSEQELIDCGHSGGYVGLTLNKYYKDNHYNAASEESYPYKGSSGSCRRSSSALTKAKLKQVICPDNNPGGNQDNVLANLMKYGPGGFLVDASCLSGYRGGIISNCPKKAGAIDHATLVVGAGEDNGVPYFIVKNSWGESFGESGYYRVKRNTNPPQLGAPGGIFGVYDDGFVV